MTKKTAVIVQRTGSDSWTAVREATGFEVLPSGALVVYTDCKVPLAAVAPGEWRAARLEETYS